jgi:hypothetical protein
MRRPLVLLFLLSLKGDNSSEGKVVHGDLWTGDNWHFLGPIL